MGAGTWESHHAICQLIFSYARLVDDADFDGLNRLFADGEIAAPQMEGTIAPSTLGDYYRTINKVQADGSLGTSHLTTNVEVDIDEEAGTATARSYFCVVQATPELPLQPIIAGRYHDTFRRSVGEWRFTQRVIDARQFGDLSAHLTFDPSSVEPPPTL